MAYHGYEVTQCEQAKSAFPGQDCPCDQCGDERRNEATVPCADEGRWPDFEDYEFNVKTHSGGLSWSELTKELSTNDHCGGSPVAFTHQRGDEAAHMYVAFGFKELDGEEYLDVYDPAPPCNPDEGGGTAYRWDEADPLNAYIWTHAYYESPAGEYEHTYDFYRISKK